MRRYIGTIIDKSYFEIYHTIKGNNAYSKRICSICLEEIELGFEKINHNGRNSGFAGTLPHICDKFKEFNLIQKLHIQLTDLNKFNPELEWGQFIFMEAGEQKEYEPDNPDHERA